MMWGWASSRIVAVKSVQVRVADVGEIHGRTAWFPGVFAYIPLDGRYHGCMLGSWTL